MSLIIQFSEFKNKSERKRNYSKREYLPDKEKKSILIVMKTRFSAGKLMKQFGNAPPLSKRTPPLSSNPLFLSNFFMTPLFVQILKTRTFPRLILAGGEGNSPLSETSKLFSILCAF